MCGTTGTSGLAPVLSDADEALSSYDGSMSQVPAAAMVLLVWSSVDADVPRRTFKSLRDVTFLAREGEPSCGKVPRDSIKEAVKAAKSITVTRTQLRMNNGEPWTIEFENSEGVFAGKTYPAPTEAYPRRKITMAMGVMMTGDDATFFVARTAESDGTSCTDAYRVSIE